MTTEAFDCDIGHEIVGLLFDGDATEIRHQVNGARLG
jgi:hypothetical protein